MSMPDGRSVVIGSDVEGVVFDPVVGATVVAEVSATHVHVHIHRSIQSQNFVQRLRHRTGIHVVEVLAPVIQPA